MRLLVDTLIALMLVGILAGLLLHRRQESVQQSQKAQVQTALDTLHDTLLYRAAMQDARLTAQGYPIALSPTWFAEQGLPVNGLVPGRQPWIDLAPVGDTSDHPPDPVIHNDEQAGFWYNPNRGVIRARVTPQFTQRAALELYNTLNRVNLRALPTPSDGGMKPMVMPILANLKQLPWDPRPEDQATAEAPMSQIGSVMLGGPRRK